MVIIIDGARYSETFGNPQFTYIPSMGNLAQQGSYLTEFYNDSITYTSRAIPALWCGSWTAVRDTFYNGSSTQYALKPTLFEYYRKQKSAPAEDCFYVLKYIANLWLPSFHLNYGPVTWPSFHSQGSTDIEVATQTQWVMDTYHPKFLWVYLADVDGAGHSGIWSNYISAILTADAIVGVLWAKIQSDPFYQDSTFLFVTNDHGRHDDQNGGFSGHGDGCPGCRHIMFLALGPNIKSNYTSNQYHRIPDLAVTVSAILGINPEYATGEIINEILMPTSIQNDASSNFPGNFTLHQNFPNPFNPRTVISWRLTVSNFVQVSIYDLAGQRVDILVNQRQPAGYHSIDFIGSGLASGVYLYRLQVGEYSERLTRLLIMIMGNFSVLLEQYFICHRKKLIKLCM
jgi:hypothetical protein